MARPNLTNEEVKVIKRRLIDAAILIIKNADFNSISIKSVAEISKMNSATIYKYFKNLDELIIYSYVDKLESYHKSIEEVNYTNHSALETYILTWKYFAAFAYDNKEIINTLFFSGNNFDLNKIIKDYFDLYNKKFNILKPSVLNMLSKSNLYERNLQVIKPILSKKYNLDEINIINDILINNFKVLLINTINKNTNYSKEEFVNKICISNEFLLKVII